MQRRSGGFEVGANFLTFFNFPAGYNWQTRLNLNQPEKKFP